MTRPIEDVPLDRRDRTLSALAQLLTRRPDLAGIGIAHLTEDLTG